MARECGEELVLEDPWEAVDPAPDPTSGHPHRIVIDVGGERFQSRRENFAKVCVCTALLGTYL